MATTKKVKFYSVGAASCFIYGKVAELIGNRQGYLTVAANSKRHAAEIIHAAEGISDVTVREFGAESAPSEDLVNAGFLMEAGDLIVEDLGNRKIVKVDGDSARLVAIRHFDQNTRITSLLVEREVAYADLHTLQVALELVDSFSLPCSEEFQRPLGVWLQAALDDLTATVMVKPGEELRPTTSSALEFAERLVEQHR